MKAKRSKGYFRHGGGRVSEEEINREGERGRLKPS